MLKLSFRSKTEEFVYKDDSFWFEKIKPYLRQDKRVLKIGAGLGFFSKFLWEFLGGKLTVLEVENNLHPQVKIPLKLYDGKKLPFADNSFDFVIANHTLHHCPDIEDFFGEISRVSKDKIFIVEEAWENWFQRLSVVFNCWLVNKRILDKIEIHPHSYLSYNGWNDLFKKNGLKVQESFFVKRSWRQRLIPYKVYLFVLEKF